MAASIAPSDAPTNEKAEVEQKQEVQKPKKGLFSKKSKVDPPQLKEKGGDVSVDQAPKPATKDLPPASFSSLFRFVSSSRLAILSLLTQVRILDSPHLSSSFWMPLAWFVPPREAQHRYVLFPASSSQQRSPNTPLPQPLMSLLFGRLTQDFVNFGSVMANTTSSDPAVAANATAALPAAAASFRHSAALNASYLVYIGECIKLGPRTTLTAFRCWNAVRNFRLHVLLGVYR